MKQRKPQEYFVYFKDFAVHSSDKRTGGWPQAGFAVAKYKKSGWQSIRTYSHSFPVGKAGILTVLLTAYGEADVQPSLLPAYIITAKAPCQALFSAFFPKDTPFSIALI